VKKTSQDLPVLLLVYPALALTGLLAFEPVRHNDFVEYDDRQYVAGNPAVQGGSTRDSVVWAFRASYASNWHPLTWLSHMLDCRLFGLDPRGHHLTSLLLHLANTLLLFTFLHRATGAVWRSAFVAAAFVLHPLRVESVAWVAERKDVLSGLFWMTTLIAYVHYTRRPNLPRFLLVFVFFGLGLMAKPMLVTLPFVLLLLDYWPLQRFPAHLGGEKSARPKDSAPAVRSRPTVLRLLAEKAPLLALAAASSVVTFLIQRRTGAMMPEECLPFNVRLANALVSYVRYLAKLVYPCDLAVLYPYPAHDWPAWQVVGSLFLLLALTAVVLYAARRRYVAVGWLWFVGALVPVIGLVQVGMQSIADRYTYLPSIGILIIVAWGLPDLLARWRHRRIVLTLSATTALALLLIATRVQVTYWRDSLALYEHTLAVTQDNYVMQTNCGHVLVTKGRFAEAAQHFAEALRINPQHSLARGNLGVLLLMQGRAEEAVAWLTPLLKNPAERPQTHANLGSAYAQLGQDDLAWQHYAQALRLDPNNPSLLYNVGLLLKKRGQIDQAIEQWQNVLRRDPEHPGARRNLGVALGEKQDYHEAIPHLRATCAANPDDFDVLNALAWILTVAPDPNLRRPAEALPLAQKACELTGYKKPELLDTLAAVHAALGQFPAAIETAEKARQLVQDAGQEQLARDIQNHLEFYRSGQPYYERPAAPHPAQP